MTDDIVTRLRLLSASQKMHRFSDLMDDWSGEAADEIERLQALLYRLEHCKQVIEGLCGWDSENTLCEPCKKAATDVVQ